MRQLIAKVSFLLATVLVPVTIGLSGQVAAVDIFPACHGGKGAGTDVCLDIKGSNASENPIIKALKVTITILSIIIGIVAVIMIIVAGLSFVTANGDAQGVARARSSIIFALVGLVIAGLAQSLVAFVLNKL